MKINNINNIEFQLEKKNINSYNNNFHFKDDRGEKEDVKVIT